MLLVSYSSRYDHHQRMLLLGKHNPFDDGKTAVRFHVEPSTNLGWCGCAMIEKKNIISSALMIHDSSLGMEKICILYQ